jgi:hypothetical protein
MKMDNLIRNIRVLWRAETIIADIKLRHLMMRSGLHAFAALVAVFGLLMFEMAAYFALILVWNPIWAAVALGAINFAIAAVLMLVASRQQPGRELELANEVQKSAVEALNQDAQALQAVPLVGMLAKGLRKPKAPPRKKDKDAND